jgi:hypothetical protein
MLGLELATSMFDSMIETLMIQPDKDIRITFIS